MDSRVEYTRRRPAAAPQLAQNMTRGSDVKLISDEILIDSGQQTPTFDATYPMFDGFNFGDPAAWTKGHPFNVYKKMREQAPVMWSPGEKGLSGIWSLTRYEDIKQTELAHSVFFSAGQHQHGGARPQAVEA